MEVVRAFKLKGMTSENGLMSSPVYSESGEIECTQKMIDALLQSIKNDTRYLTSLHASAQCRTHVMLGVMVEGEEKSAGHAGKQKLYSFGNCKSPPILLPKPKLPTRRMRTA